MIIENDENNPDLSKFHQSASESVNSQPLIYSRRRIRNGLFLTLLGFLVFLLGARPSVFDLDRSPVIGFVQIAAMLLGLGIICIGAYISMLGLWKNTPISIAAELGVRLVATGFVITVVAGMADVFGLGSHPLPKLFFGPWQAMGVEIGELVIGIGILLLVPYHRLFAKLRKDSPPVEETESENQ